MSNGVLYRAVCAVVASLALSGMASAAIDIETVHVGNAGNAADPLTGYGSVAYEYNIGKYEVTAGQYAAFLNAVAKTDTYSVYNSSMANLSNGSGITRSGSAGNYSYSVDPAFVQRPVNCVSFWDGTRFANWLSNGQPTGAQGAGTTETGTYTLTADGIAKNTITRNSNATWAVTSEDEWYKAAYHKNNGAGAGYYLYPTSSDTAPGNDLADASGNNANYYTGSGAYPIDSGKYTTVAGQFKNSASPYGTFDQGGNVWEWNEAQIDGSCRRLRGGSLIDLDNNLRADDSSYNYGDPSLWGSNVGFRVALVPEPGAMAVLALGALGLLPRRRGVRR